MESQAPERLSWLAYIEVDACWFKYIAGDDAKELALIALPFDTFLLHNLQAKRAPRV